LKNQRTLKFLTLENNNLEIMSFEHFPASCKNLVIKKNKVHISKLGDYDFEDIVINNCEILELEKIYSSKIDFSYCDL